MNGLNWGWKWKYDVMIKFCSRAQFSNQIINRGAASNLWTMEGAQINLSEIFSPFLIINEPNLWITTLPDFRLVSKNLGNLRWFLTSSFMILTNKNPWRNLLRGVTKSGDYAANIHFPHAWFDKSFQLEHRDIDVRLPLTKIKLEDKFEIQ